MHAQVSRSAVGGYPHRVTESDDWPSYLRAAMRAKNIDSASELAEKAGINRSVISQWLNDRAQPTIPNLDKLKGPLGRPLIEMMVAAGLISKEDARIRELPIPAKPDMVDEIEQEILDAGYPPEIEKLLLKMRQDNREQIRATIEALRVSGRLNGKAKRSNSA